MAVTAALVSLLSGRLARSDTAMTGEVTLRGHVLPVGGVRQKVLAAHRAGLTRVLLPAANEKDLHEVSAKVRGELSIVFVRSVDEALPLALLPACAEEAAAEEVGEEHTGRTQVDTAAEPQQGVLARSRL